MKFLKGFTDLSSNETLEGLGSDKDVCRFFKEKTFLYSNKKILKK
jgi:hypothetical protein